AVRFRDQRGAAYDEKTHLFRHVLGLRVSERDKAPVILPGLIKNRANALALGCEILRVDRPNFDAVFGGAAVYDFSKSLGWSLNLGKPPCVPVFFFDETALLTEARVILRIIRRENGRRMCKAVDDESANIVGGVIDRTHKFAAAASAHPGCRGVEKRRRNIDIVDRFKQTETADVRLVKRDVIGIVACHDAPYDFAIASGEKKCGIPVFIKRMPLAIEECLAFDDERRHPGGIAFVNAPRKLDERSAFLARPNLRNFNSRQRTGGFKPNPDE